MSRYRFIEAQRSQYPVRLLCQLVEVSASGYYAWQQLQQALLWDTAAPRRTAAQGLSCRAPAPARRWGLHALQPKAFTPRTTDSTHRLRCAPNRLLNQPRPTRANQVWVSDITYLPLANGDWAYRCAYQDMVSKQVVRWHVMAKMHQ